MAATESGRAPSSGPNTLADITHLLNEPLITIAERSISPAKILLVVLTVVVGYLFVRWLERFTASRMSARQLNPDLVHLVRRLVLVLGVLILAFTTLDLLDIPLTAFAFVSGAVAIGVGFGAQNIINNFISGWILMWERPIRIGDFLELDATTRGTVEAINTRSTLVRRVDGVHLLVPNSHLLENTVVNWTLIDRRMRTLVRVGVAYGTPTRLTADLLMQAVQERSDVLPDPKPVVIFDDFGDNALMFDTYFWIHAIGDRDLRVVRSEIRHRIAELFAENGITIAFPQRDVHLDTLAPLEVHLKNATGAEPPQPSK